MTQVKETQLYVASQKEIASYFEEIAVPSFNFDDESTGGGVLFLKNDRINRACAIYWRVKQIVRVCHNSKMQKLQT